MEGRGQRTETEEEVRESIWMRIYIFGEAGEMEVCMRMYLTYIYRVCGICICISVAGDCFPSAYLSVCLSVCMSAYRDQDFKLEYRIFHDGLDVQLFFLFAGEKCKDRGDRDNQMLQSLD